MYQGRIPLPCATLLAAAFVSTVGTASAQSLTDSEPTLDEVRQAAERFRDVRTALAEGYIPDPENMCVTAEMEGLTAEDGVMGIHYLRPDLLRLAGEGPRVNGHGTHTDFRTPAILIYEPQEDGSLELVAVENLVFIEAWEAEGNEGPPVFRGVEWNRMVDDPATPFDEAHGFEPHYDLHVWVFRDNPDGVFAPFNRNATCRHHRHDGVHRK
jgi:hypothetical protein